MIVSKLKGGLGNQLFQYAIGRALSIKHKKNLYLDVSDFEHQNHRVVRTYDLGSFNINATTFISKDELPKTFFQRLLNKEIVFNEVIENGFEYDVEKTKVIPPLCIDGYWQSYKYFEEISSDLYNEITLNKPLSDEAKLFHNQMLGRETVAVHFRRGDYVTDSTTNTVHGVCSDEYYFAALNYFKNYNSNLQVFIFSDDIEFIKNKLIDCKEYIFVDKLTNHIEEFELMKRCNHFVISNSTFSWWAAWLSNSSNKKVIAPKLWFRDETLQNKSNDLIPVDWIRI